MGATMAFRIFVATLVMMGLANMVVAVVDNGEIHVEGKVLCQDCSQGWNEWIHGAKPIKDSKVSITCMDERRRVVYYASDLTDEAGQFNMVLNKCYAMGKELNTKQCWVRLVSSPDPSCNILTDFAGGKSGIKLNRPSMVYRNLIKFMLSPLYYTTPMCHKPDIPANDDVQG